MPPWDLHYAKLGPNCGGQVVAMSHEVSITSMTLPLSPLTKLISEGFYDAVHELGCGFSERVCQKALAIVLRDKGLLVEPEYSLTVSFRGQNIGSFEPDLIVERLVIVEVKAVRSDRRLVTGSASQLPEMAPAAESACWSTSGNAPSASGSSMGDPWNSLPRLSKAPIANLERWHATCTRCPDDHSGPP